MVLFCWVLYGQLRILAVAYKSQTWSNEKFILEIICHTLSLTLTSDLLDLVSLMSRHRWTITTVNFLQL